MDQPMDARWRAARQELADASAKAGVDPGVVAKIAGFESGFNPQARPIASRKHEALNTVAQFDGIRAMSSAYGYGQFTDSTWAGIVRQYGRKYGVADAERLTSAQANAPELRTDSALQAAMLAEFNRENSDKGALLGGPDADANVYALHNLGSTTGARFLEALKNDPDQRVDDVLADAIVERNPALYGDGSRTVAEAYSTMGRQMDRYAAYAEDIRRAASTRTAAHVSMTLPAGGHGTGVAARPLPSRLLRERDHGSDVRTLQSRLRQLGYSGPQGEPLVVDGYFGPATLAAVKAFQRDHHLALDGVADPLTWRQMETRSRLQMTPSNRAATAAPVLLDHPDHPDHALFQQALQGVYRLDAARARKPDRCSNNLAGALAVAAKAEGLGRIDQVTLDKDGSRAFASQEILPGTSCYRHAAVATDRAINTSLQESSRQIETTAQTPLPQAPTQVSDEVANKALQR